MVLARRLRMKHTETNDTKHTADSRSDLHLTSHSTQDRKTVLDDRDDNVFNLYTHVKTGSFMILIIYCFHYFNQISISSQLRVKMFNSQIKI